MHMADALLSPAVGGTFYAASAGLLAYSAKKVVKEDDYEKKLPLMGVLGAFVFAAQMINFTIPGTGSSGHIGGGMLLAILLGPYAALLVIASVLLVQCLFFADGGLLALGCNIFNLGFWPAFVGLPLYRAITKNRAGLGITTAAAVIAVVVALELGAMGVVLQTLLSGRSELPFAQFSSVMLGIHVPIAVIEGLITAGVVQFVYRTLHVGSSPTTLTNRDTSPAVVALLGLALFVGTVFAWFASASPDGLEWSIARVYGSEELPPAQHEIAGKLENVQGRTAFLPDYGFAEGADGAEVEAEEAGEAWPAVSAGTSLSGFVGSLITGALVLLAGGFLLLFRDRRGQPDAVVP